MTTASTCGQRVGGKPVNLGQLEAEMITAGVTVDSLGMADDYVYTHDADGVASDFPVADQPTVDQVIADHVAMRDKTDAEYATEFQDPNTTPARRQEIRDITGGLLPREQVPMTAEDMP